MHSLHCCQMDLLQMEIRLRHYGTTACYPPFSREPWVVQPCSNSGSVLFSSKRLTVLSFFIIPFLPQFGLQCLVSFLIPGQKLSLLYCVYLKSSTQLAHMFSTVSHCLILFMVLLKSNMIYSFKLVFLLSLWEWRLSFVSFLASASELDRKHELCSYWANVEINPSEINNVNTIWF